MDEDFRFELPRPLITQRGRIPVGMSGPKQGQYLLNRRMIGVGQVTGQGKLPTGNNTYALLYYMRGDNVTISMRGWLDGFNPNFVTEGSLLYYQRMMANSEPGMTPPYWFGRTVDRTEVLEALSIYARTESDRDRFLADLGSLTGYEIIDIDQLEVIPGSGASFA